MTNRRPGSGSMAVTRTSAQGNMPALLGRYSHTVHQKKFNKILSSVNIRVSQHLLIVGGISRSGVCGLGKRGYRYRYPGSSEFRSSKFSDSISVKKSSQITTTFRHCPKQTKVTCSGNIVHTSSTRMQLERISYFLCTRSESCVDHSVF